MPQAFGDRGEPALGTAEALLQNSLLRLLQSDCLVSSMLKQQFWTSRCLIAYTTATFANPSLYYIRTAQVGFSTIPLTSRKCKEKGGEVQVFTRPVVKLKILRGGCGEITSTSRRNVEGCIFAVLFRMCVVLRHNRHLARSP
jgi:hypothetical protein